MKRNSHLRKEFFSQLTTFHAEALHCAKSLSMLLALIEFRTRRICGCGLLILGSCSDNLPLFDVKHFA